MVFDDEDNSFHKLPEISISEYDKYLLELNLHLLDVALIDKIGVVRALLGYSRVKLAGSRDSQILLAAYALAPVD